MQASLCLYHTSPSKVHISLEYLEKRTELRGFKTPPQLRLKQTKQNFPSFVDKFQTLVYEVFCILAKDELF